MSVCATSHEVMTLCPQAYCRVARYTGTEMHEATSHRADYDFRRFAPPKYQFSLPLRILKPGGSKF